MVLYILPHFSISIISGINVCPKLKLTYHDLPCRNTSQYQDRSPIDSQNLDILKLAQWHHVHCV